MSRVKEKMAKKTRILIVDDYMGICSALTAVFGEEGYETETAGTGKDAIEKAQENFFNISLLDIKLPDTEGINLVAPLKELHPDMDVLMITGHASLETAVRALHEGASAYIIKPLNMHEVLGVVRDALEKQRLIEEKLLAEEELKEYSEHLEEMVEERTKELREAHEELIRKEKLTVLGQLASGVGHELLNPLGAIKNVAYYLNMVLEGPESNVKEILDILDKEVAVCESIISSLFDFARSTPLLKREVDINDIIRGVFSHTTVPEKVEVVRQLDEVLPTILGDRDQLDQVFGHIILNAIQAMPEGGQLTVKSEFPSQEWVAISFTDTGIGIHKDNLGKVFDPLYTTKAKGIGLGLAIIKDLVETHGGTIEVQSEVGKGSTFTIRLPTGRDEKKD